METALMILIGVMSFLAGILAIFIYMIIRMLRSKSWDDSNITNALRLIAHVSAHPNDFTKMYYLSPADLELLKQHGFNPKKPFWYLSKDEFSEVVKTRP